MIMLTKALHEIKKQDANLTTMIERADEMIPKKKGVLDPKNVWEKKPNAKIIGEDGEIMPNKYLKRFEEITRK